MAALGPQMANGVWKGVQSWVIGRSCQLSLNKFFDLSAPSMRNIEPPAKSEMADRVWKVVYPKIFGRFCHLSLNKFLDPSTPSIRKVGEGEEKKRKTRNKRKEW